MKEVEQYNEMLIKCEENLMNLKNAKAMLEIADTIRKASIEIIEQIIKIKEQEEIKSYSNENQNEGKEITEEEMDKMGSNNESTA